MGSATTTKEGGGVLGRHGLGQRNAAGEELLRFCERNALAVANTFFRHRAAQKATWQNPAATSLSAGLACLDYALVKRQWLSSVRDVRVRRSGDLRARQHPQQQPLSDHRLLACTLRLKLRPPSRHPRPARPDRAALAQPDKRAALQAAAGASMAAAHPTGQPGADWQQLTDALLECAHRVLPAAVEDLQPHRPYIGEHTLALVAQRRELQQGAVNTAPRTALGVAARAQLARLRHRITRSLARDMRRHARLRAARIGRLARSGNSHAFWMCIKQLAGSRAAASGQHGGQRQPSVAEFASHFEALHRDGATVDTAVLDGAAVPPNLEPWPLPSLADTLGAVRRLKHWRAADPAGVWAELLQAACLVAAVAHWLHSIVISALLLGMPAVVKESRLLPFHKKGDALDPNNYRGIQLISLLRKILALILAVALARCTNSGLLEYQCGFRPQRSCTDQLFTLRKLSELALEWQQRLYLAFVDLRKAFDSISRPALWVILRARGVPEQLITHIVDLHTDTSCRVRVGGRCSPQFRMEFGVQQGCPLASLLFNIFFDHVVREALADCAGCGITVQRRSQMGANLQQPNHRARAQDLEELIIPVLMLADDLVILARTAAELQQFVAAFEKACRRWGLTISTSKTELMLVGGAAATACEGCSLQHERGMVLCDGCDRGWHLQCLDPPLAAVPEGTWHCPACAAADSPLGDAWRPPVLVGGQPLVWTERFKYLGSIFHCSGGLDAEIAHRMQLAAYAFRVLERSFFRQQSISIRARMAVYTSMVTSVLLYGSEAWSLTAAQLQHLEVFHHQRLRMILGVRWADRISTEQLLAKCKSSRIADMIARRQLRWLGHLGRMAHDRLALQVLHSTMGGPGRRRRVGRPAPNLCDAYDALVREHLGSSRLRAEGLSRNATWLDACKDRGLFRGLCNTT